MTEKKKLGRPKMLRAAQFPWLLEAAEVERNAFSSTLGETLARFSPILTGLRSDDRAKILLRMFDIFGVPRESLSPVLVHFGIFPPKEKIRPKNKARKPRTAARVPDLGPRRACRYGSGAYPERTETNG